MMKNPNKPGIKIPLPRHTEIDEYTAKGILKEAGLFISSTFLRYRIQLGERSFL